MRREVIMFVRSNCPVTAVLDKQTGLVTYNYNCDTIMGLNSVKTEMLAKHMIEKSIITQN